MLQPPAPGPASPPGGASPARPPVRVWGPAAPRRPEHARRPPCGPVGRVSVDVHFKARVKKSLIFLRKYNNLNDTCKLLFTSCKLLPIRKRIATNPNSRPFT